MIIKNSVRLGVTALAFFASLSALSQVFIPKGAVAGGGGFSFSSQTEKYEQEPYSYEDRHTLFSIDPAVMFFVIDNLGVGAALSFESEKTKSVDSDDEYSASGIGIGPRVRYYFAEGPFAEASFAVGSGKASQTGFGTTIESRVGLSTWEIGPGYSVRISDSILLDSMIGYGSSSLKVMDSDGRTTNKGFFIRVGFTMILVR